MPNPSKAVGDVPGETVVACSICLAEIPHSVAKSHEAVEYVYYFCGDACFAQWEAEGAAEVGVKAAGAPAEGKR